MADVGLAYAGSEALLRRHVFSAGQPLWARRDFRRCSSEIAEAWRDGPRTASWNRAREVMEQLRAAGAALDGRRRPHCGRRAGQRHFSSFAGCSIPGSAASAARPSFRALGSQFPAALHAKRTGNAEALDMVADYAVAHGEGRNATTSWAAAFIAIRWTNTGSCRISRRCSTTRRSLRCRTWKRSRSPHDPAVRRQWRAGHSITCCAT